MDLIGRKMGGFEILDKVGEGSCARVYRAVQEGIGRHVALKVVPRNLLAGDRLVNRFLREARIVGKLSHPGIVPVFSFGEEGLYYYFAMELIRGPSLLDILAKGIHFDVHRTLQIGILVAEALDHSHRAGIIHRDIKPANILIEGSRVVLTDFGLARDLSGTAITTTGDFIGTPNYTSPEQARREKATERSDIYSLGSVLYHLLTGKRAFQARRGDPPHIVCDKIAQNRPVPVRERNPKIPEEVARVVEKAMACNPANRYASAGEFAASLRGCLPDSDPDQGRSTDQIPVNKERSTGEVVRDLVADGMRKEGEEERIGEFVVLEEIARGGMGTVYRAYDRQSRRTVALKVLPAGKAAWVERFLAEARMAMKLDHANIVKVHEFGEDRGRHYIVMDFVRGQNLRELIAQIRVLGEVPDLRIARTMLQVAEAIAHAHSQGIVHRDIKPGNILVDRRGHVFLTDFGLGLDLFLDKRMTATGEVIGSPQYMAPEQVLGEKEKIGTWTDVYQMGAVLYELIANRPPFEHEDVIELMRMISNRAPRPPSACNKYANRELERISLKAMGREPQLRYASALDLVSDLQRFIEDRSSRQMPDLPGRARRVLPGGALAWAACGFVLAAALFFGYSWLSGAPGPAASKDAQALLGRARQLQAEGVLDEALVLAENAIEVARTDPEAYALRGAIHQALGKLRKARNDFTSALTLRSAASYRLQRAIVLFRLGEHPESLADLEAFLSASPGHARALYWASRCHLELKQFDQALRRAREAARADRANPVYRDFVARIEKEKAGKG